MAALALPLAMPTNEVINISIRLPEHAKLGKLHKNAIVALPHWGVAPIANGNPGTISDVRASTRFT